MCFSVIITTRNRATQFAIALQSVLRQDIVDQCEVIVVIDGSDDRNMREYETIRLKHLDQVKFITLEHTPKGHGQSYAINIGASHATKSYLAFLDDDDEWILDTYLSTMRYIIETHCEVDLIYSNQTAYQRGVATDYQGWLADLPTHINPNKRPDETGCFDISVAELMSCRDFCHLNTTVIRRLLFETIEGLDETIRYECDRDFFFRSIDRAAMIKYIPIATSKHNVPDKTKRDNMSTSIGNIEKYLYRLKVLNKALLFSRHDEIVKLSKKHLGYTIKRLAEESNSVGRVKIAACYARQGLVLNFSFKWLLFCMLLFFRSQIQIVASDKWSKRNFEF